MTRPVEREQRISQEADTDDLTRVANRRAHAADRVRAAFVTPLVLEGEQVRLHAAVGVARYPADGRDIERLLVAADRAMYARKTQSP